MNADKGIKLEDNKAICETCGQWQYTNAKKRGKIVHSRSCTNSDAQYGQFMVAPVAVAEIPNPVGKYSPDSPGSGLSNEELRDAVHRGYLTPSDAMNTDY